MLQQNHRPSLAQKLFRADQVRQHEENAANQSGITIFDLMLKAGKAVYEHSVSLFPNT